jgi:hypothetical protein
MPDENADGGSIILGPNGALPIEQNGWKGGLVQLTLIEFFNIEKGIY